MASKRLFSDRHIKGHKNGLPEGYPQWRWLDYLHDFEQWKNANPGIHGLQVQAFILLAKLHDYIAYARHELEVVLGAPLCQEHCCCLSKTPFVTRLEAEYIIANTGYYSSLLEIAEEWLLTPYEEAPTLPADIPAIAGGKAVPMRELPQVAQEAKALFRMRSPFLLSERLTAQDRLISGPWAKTSYVDGTNLYHAENFDLLERTQPLMCAVSGVFTLPPEHCTRRLGFGETADTRTLADPATLQQGYTVLQGLYEKAPEREHYSFLPTMLVLAANPTRFATLVTSGKVALAKLAINTKGRFPFKLWEQSYAGWTERRVMISGAGHSGGTRLSRN